MGKQGPCCHCGISTTPLWRNGPPEKPVLCNACGSRWKTKGTLLNYMPMHSGGFGINTEFTSDLKWSRGRKGSHKHAEQRSHKRKEPCDSADRESGQFRANQSVLKGHEEETASISSAVSGISGSELCRGTCLAKDPPVIGRLWDGPIPVKKRSAILRHRTPVDKLTRSLASLFLDPSSVSCDVPSLSSEALLVEYNKPSLVALEIGLGSVFVRQPVSVAQESESGTNLYFTQSEGDESFNALGQSESGSTSLALGGRDEGSALRGKDKVKQVLRKPGGGRLHNERTLIPNKALLEIFPYNKRDVLQSCQSPLVFLEMKDIVNFDTFTGLLTEQEQGHLIQFLSSVDAARIPESLKSMFNSAQFEGALNNFQQILLEGMFDSSELGLSPRGVLQHFQQLLNVTDLTGSGWMERCSHLQNRNKRRGAVDLTKVIQNKELSREKLKGPWLGAATSASCGFYGAKQPFSGRPFEKFEEDIKVAKTNCFTGATSSTFPAIFENINPVKHDLTIKAESLEPFSGAIGSEAGAKVEGACFLSNSPFLSTAERGPTIEDEEYMDIGGIDSGEADSLLFDVPNPMSFQQAELLQQPSWAKADCIKEEENDAAQLESGGLIMSNTWHTDTNPAEWSLFWNSSTCAGPGQALPNGTVLNPGRMLM